MLRPISGRRKFAYSRSMKSAPTSIAFNRIANPQLLRMRLRSALSGITTSHNDRNPSPTRRSDFGDQCSDGIAIEGGKVVRPQFEHLGPGGDRIFHLPLRPIQVLCRYGNRQMSHDSPEI